MVPTNISTQLIHIPLLPSKWFVARGLFNTAQMPWGVSFKCSQKIRSLAQSGNFILRQQPRPWPLLWNIPEGRSWNTNRKRLHSWPELPAGILEMLWGEVPRPDNIHPAIKNMLSTLKSCSNSPSCPLSLCLTNSWSSLTYPYFTKCNWKNIPITILTLSKGIWVTPSLKKTGKETWLKKSLS